MTFAADSADQPPDSNLGGLRQGLEAVGMTLLQTTSCCWRCHRSATGRTSMAGFSGTRGSSTLRGGQRDKCSCRTEALYFLVGIAEHLSEHALGIWPELRDLIPCSHVCSRHTVGLVGDREFTTVRPDRSENSAINGRSRSARIGTGS